MAHSICPMATGSTVQLRSAPLGHCAQHPSPSQPDVAAPPPTPPPAPRVAPPSPEFPPRSQVTAPDCRGPRLLGCSGGDLPGPPGFSLGRRGPRLPSSSSTLGQTAPPTWMPAWCQEPLLLARSLVTLGHPKHHLGGLDMGGRGDQVRWTPFQKAECLHNAFSEEGEPASFLEAFQVHHDYWGGLPSREKGLRPGA